MNNGSFITYPRATEWLFCKFKTTEEVILISRDISSCSRQTKQLTWNIKLKHNSVLRNILKTQFSTNVIAFNPFKWKALSPNWWKWNVTDYSSNEIINLLSSHSYRIHLHDNCSVHELNDNSWHQVIKSFFVAKAALDIKICWAKEWNNWKTIPNSLPKIYEH